MSSEYRPRLSAELTEEQAIRLTTILPHGFQKPLFQALVNGVLELYDRGGLPALGAIVSSHISITQLANLGAEKTKRDIATELQVRLNNLQRELIG